MRYEKPKPKWEWREFLTETEAQTILRADLAKHEWRKLNTERASIVNRAIQRAKARAKALIAGE